jgi:hypothetical protein
MKRETITRVARFAAFGLFAGFVVAVAIREPVGTVIVLFLVALLRGEG